MRKLTKKGGKKKEGNLPKPLPSCSFFRPPLSLLPTTICIKNKKQNYSLTFRCSSSILFKAGILKKNFSDFGPNLVVFFVFWGFERFRILEILNCNSYELFNLFVHNLSKQFYFKLDCEWFIGSERLLTVKCTEKNSAEQCDPTA